MKDYKFNEKTYQIPESWNEITIKQVIDLDELSDLMPDAQLIALISTYTGIPLDELKVSNLSEINEILSIMDFINTEYVPKPTNEFEFKGSKYSCLPDLREQEFQDWLSIQNILYANKDNPAKGLARMISVYCKKSGESLDDIDLNEREKLFMELPITDARSIESFFLANLHACNIITQLSLREPEMEKAILQSFNELSSTMKASAMQYGWYSPTKYAILIYQKYLLYLKKELEVSFRSTPTKPLSRSMSRTVKHLFLKAISKKR
jgi:hypothetical protein